MHPLNPSNFDLFSASKRTNTALGRKLASQIPVGELMLYHDNPSLEPIMETMKEVIRFTKSNNPDDYSENNPLGNSITRYDIEKEKELMKND